MTYRFFPEKWCGVPRQQKKLLPHSEDQKNTTLPVFADNHENLKWDKSAWWFVTSMT
jgi:hypothetical protein